MSASLILARIRRALGKPPSTIVRRLMAELRHEFDRFSQPGFGRRFGVRQLLQRTGHSSVEELWDRVVTASGGIFPAVSSIEAYEGVCPGDLSRIVAAAEAAIAFRVNLLGSGPVQLGAEIEWCRDLRTGYVWPSRYFRGIDYVNRGQPSDVKTVWELSRLQWVLPCGQAFVLTGDEKYARAAKGILDRWIDANPYSCSVNWGVTMEVAMRIFSIAWLLRACGRSAAWNEGNFRERLLCTLYLHAVFTERFLERSDVNGNHFTADAAALVLAGAVFGRGDEPQRWMDSSLRDLEVEIRRQVHPDGVDFEASTAYHRLVAELFLLASMAAGTSGYRTSDEYRRRLAGMARFTAAYTRPDGAAPLWGDHDDARTLPFGPQPIRDHRYLVGLIALHLRDTELMALAGGPRAEAAWLFGVQEAARLPERTRDPASQAFHDGGVYVIRGHGDHVFIDCGPIGLAGRGGHGHNDILSFEAVLDHVPLITEGGCFVYTADFDSRNRDRSVRSHNAPMVDGEEPNRFVDPDCLWVMHEDAKAGKVRFEADDKRALFSGSHDGYRRLADGVVVSRSIAVDHRSHALTVSDRFVGTGLHTVEVFLHLAPGCAVSVVGDGAARVSGLGRGFDLRWQHTDWSFGFDQGREAPSYGVAREVIRLTWRRTGTLAPLDVHIAPSAAGVSA